VDFGFGNERIREFVKRAEIVEVVYPRGQKSDVGDQLVLFPLTSLYFGA
jgi:hypothetical protein